MGFCISDVSPFFESQKEELILAKKKSFGRNLYYYYWQFPSSVFYTNRKTKRVANFEPVARDWKKSTS